MKFRFHCLGLPHTATNADYLACAYTQKVRKFLKMMSRRGHRCIHYGNEGSQVPDAVEHVQLFSEAERSKFFGQHDATKQYDIEWDPNLPYWYKYSQRAAPALAERCKKGDFICLITAPYMYRNALDQFPGAYSGICYGPMAVEYGIGYYGYSSRYRCYESSSHREFCHGMRNYRIEDNLDAVIPNYFDLDEFSIKPDAQSLRKLQALTADPYYLFVGRINKDKGYEIAIEVTHEIGAKLIIAGALSGSSFDPSSLPSHVRYYGPVNMTERAYLMRHCIAGFAPSRYREPFCGVSVEFQLCGRPCITTDHAAFLENCATRWRCASHHEFMSAAKDAQTLTDNDFAAIQSHAENTWSLEAVAPLYERYFGRLYSLWGNGWYEQRPLEQLMEPRDDRKETSCNSGSIQTE